jgi:hypothetical protein
MTLTGSPAVGSVAGASRRYGVIADLSRFLLGIPGLILAKEVLSVEPSKGTIILEIASTTSILG